MGEKKDVNIDSTNIFDEFSGDEKIKQEVKNQENEKNKNIAYYINIVSNFFTTINLILLFCFIILGAYIYIQNDEGLNDANYLDPICNIFVDDLGDNGSCGSVSSLIKKYNSENNELKEKYYKQNLSLIQSIYKNFNFLDSKEVSFLINKSKNRLKVLKILSDFDKLKNDFSPLNKTLLRCENINVSSDYTIDIQCSAYSGDWESKILGYSGENKGKDKVYGTSISVASSFINFIEKYKPKEGESQFFILEKPKKFNFIEIVDDNGYTRKTDFKLKLKYQNNNLLPKI